MELLSFSTPSSYYPSGAGAGKLRQSFPEKPPQSLSLRSTTPPQLLSVKCSNDSTAKALGLDFGNQIEFRAPQTPETSMRGAESDVAGLLLKERIVFLGTQIDDYVADAVISQLLLLDSQDPSKDIKLFINSTGGSLSGTLAIYDILKLVRADVSTIAMGISASTASIVLAGGTKGKRYAMPNARIMIHQPLGGASGRAKAVEVQAQEMQIAKNNVVRIFAEESGRTFKQVERDIDRDRYMSPIEAVEYGLLDGIIDEDRIIPLVPLPEMVKMSTLDEQMLKEGEDFLNPDIPDDEIY